MRRLATLVLTAWLAVACAATPPSPGSSGTAASARSTDPAIPTPSVRVASPGATPEPSRSIVVGGERPVAIHVPPAYDASRPAPLLIVLHGYGSTGRQHDAYFRLGEPAAARGYLYAYPDGTIDRQGNHFWNATDACCDFDRKGVDDVGYLDSVIAAAGAQLNVDPKRVYLVGHSNGGFMSYAMACAHAERVAAFVSLAGATFARAADCAPREPVAVAEVHGSADEVIAFGGGAVQIGNQPMAPYPGADATSTTWATYDGCGTKVTPVLPALDLDPHLDGEASPAETTRRRWSGCHPGGAVELWTIVGGSHSPDLTDGFATAVLDFLGAHPKP